MTDTNKSMRFAFLYNVKGPDTFNVIIVINIVPVA